MFLLVIHTSLHLENTFGLNYKQFKEVTISLFFTKSPMNNEVKDDRRDPQGISTFQTFLTKGDGMQNVTRQIAL